MLLHQSMAQDFVRETFNAGHTFSFLRRAIVHLLDGKLIAIDKIYQIHRDGQLHNKARRRRIPKNSLRSFEARGEKTPSWGTIWSKALNTRTIRSSSWPFCSISFIAMSRARARNETVNEELTRASTRALNTLGEIWSIKSALEFVVVILDEPNVFSESQWNSFSWSDWKASEIDRLTIVAIPHIHTLVGPLSRCYGHVRVQRTRRSYSYFVSNLFSNVSSSRDIFFDPFKGSEVIDAWEWPWSCTAWSCCWLRLSRSCLFVCWQATALFPWIVSRSEWRLILRGV